MKRIVGEEIELEESKYFGEGVVAASSARREWVSGRTRKNSVTISSALALSPALISSLRYSTTERAKRRVGKKERERGETQTSRERGREREALAGSVPGE